ncbi:Plasmalemma vesicle-associated protein [Oryzias melastigma]|uniref:Plasmalemma vesicle associated protein b n=1 Tax=Oryzias melastigma TaxID=30732 RepID=A0A3B3BFT3_ORYME|nr:plasmalemma vesicle associated protein b [Oryzias melastigma]KAF6734403.1 Plasmalemma vesicle-associated protein [Oryzias melastigma]
MYSSSYTRAKLGPFEGREPLRRSKGKSCGYYMRIVFFFSSLIQTLIIVSLVLFLIYGQPEKSAEEKRVMELEQGFKKLSDNNVQLRKDKADLGSQLSARTAEKAALEKEIEKLNRTEQQLRIRIASYERAASIKTSPRCPIMPIQPPSANSNNEVKGLQSVINQQKAKIDLIDSNFTQTVQYLSQERDNALRDRDLQLQEAIRLRKDNTLVKEQLHEYTRKCKEDFASSLDGIQTVTRDFLNRISGLFPHYQTFHLTCESQRLEMEKIKSSCTNLSRDIENKFQMYLDNVGKKVAEIQALSSQKEVQSRHLSADLKQCEDKMKDAIATATKELERKQGEHDEKVEKLLIEQNRLREEKKNQEEKVAQKDREILDLQTRLSNKGVPSRTGVPYGASQPGGQTPTNFSSSGNPGHGISKTPTMG